MHGRRRFKPDGVTLGFTPVVRSPGRISLRLTTEVTDIDFENTFTFVNMTVPGTKTRQAELTVELPSGEPSLSRVSSNKRS